MRAAASCLTAVALAITGTLAGIQLTRSGPVHADEVTAGQNQQRDDWDSQEPGLSPASVQGGSFSKMFGTQVNGQVYAQPVVVGGSVLVATENDYVYSLDRNTGAVNWSRQLGSPWATTAENCSRVTITPYVGVTSTPVYDPASGELYVAGVVSGAPGDDSDMTTTTPKFDLFALNAKTGAIDWQKTISGNAANYPSAAFNPATELQRTGLLLLNGSVYMGFGSYCEPSPAPFEGFIAGVNTSSHTTTLWSDQADSNANDGGIWQSGGGLMSDGTHIFFTTGNGTVPPAGAAGNSQPADLGQSVVRLDVDSTTGALSAGDFFAAGNADQLNNNDWDFGSGGTIGLPFGTTTYPHLIAVAGKEARVFLLDQDNLGGRSSSETGSTAVFTGTADLVGNTSGTVARGLWGHMAAFASTSTSGYLYYEGTGWGGSAPLQVLKFDGSNPAAPVLTNVAQTTQQFGFSSGSPVVTSNGAAASSAIVWEVHSGGNTGTNGALDAFSAVPNSSGGLQLLWTAPIGNAAEFSVPATDAGEVYVGARNDATTAASTACAVNFESATYTATDSPCVGTVYGFGVPRGQLAASATSLTFGHVSLGQSASQTVTLTNSGGVPVTITAFKGPHEPYGTPAPMAAGQQVAAGASVSLPVTFTPQSQGTTTDRYTITETDGSTPARTVTINLSGVGVAPASGVAVPSPGGGWQLNGSAMMTGTTLAVTPAVTKAAGSAVYYQPQASAGLQATFTAQLSGGSGGDGMAFAMVSPGDTASALGHDGNMVGFGGMHGVAVVLGTHQDLGFPSANFVGIATGTSGSGTSAQLVFAATSTAVPNLRSGTHVIGVSVTGSSGTSRTVTVTVDGTQYLSTSVTLPNTVLPAFTGGTGTLTDIHAVSGVSLTSSTGAIPPPGGGWSYNGSAQMSGSDTQLTQATANQAGTVIYPKAINTASDFSATFNTQIGGGTGANGMSFALLSPTTKVTAVGANGQGIGLVGLPGTAVVLATYKAPGSPSANYIALTSGSANGVPTITSSDSSIAPLRTGTHTVTVTLKSGTLTVYLDGAQVLQQAFSMPSALLAFTGSTGGRTDIHVARNAALAFSAWAS